MCTGIKKNEKKESKQINEDLAFHSDFGRLYYLLNEKKAVRSKRNIIPEQCLIKQMISFSLRVHACSNKML